MTSRDENNTEPQRRPGVRVEVDLGHKRRRRRLLRLSLVDSRRKAKRHIRRHRLVRSFP